VSKIEWTDATWNPIAGCSKVSPGCANCYAETMAKRLSAMGQEKYKNAVDVKGRWSGSITFDEKALLKPLKIQKPTRFFVNSMSDLFHENVRDEWIDSIFAVMANCPQHTFQILTKRPERMMEYLTAKTEGYGMQSGEVKQLTRAAAAIATSGMGKFGSTFSWPLQNVWLGVSVENQQAANERIPLLLQAPAAVRFLSIEPLLGSVNLNSTLGGVQWIDGQRGCDGKHYGIGSNECPKWLHHHHDHRCQKGIDWVIVGGESGPGARPMHPQWARDLRDQCVKAGVPFFFKQWGEHLHTDQITCEIRKQFSFNKWINEPSDGFVRTGKKLAGRELEGRTWDEMPEVKA
jgi:protein gp37